MARSDPPSRTRRNRRNPIIFRGVRTLSCTTGVGGTPYMHCQPPHAPRPSAIDLLASGSHVSLDWSIHE